MITPNTKQALRQLMRAVRKDITETDRHIAERALAEHLDLLPIRTGGKVAIYLRLGSEIGLPHVISTLQAKGVQLFAPITQATEALQFAELSGELIPGLHGIFQPRADGVLIQAQDLDLVFMPLLAFDDLGNRLGQGGGYYDRTFAQLSRPPLCIGVAFDEQKIDSVPAESHDLKLHAMLTPSGLKFF